MPPIGDHRRRRARIGFFPKPCHQAGAWCFGQFVAQFDIAVAGFRPVRLHAEGDEFASPRRMTRDAQGRAQRRFLGHGRIRRHHPDHGTGRFLGNQQRRGRDRRRAVPAARLQNDTCAFDAGLAQLFGDQKPMLLVAHHHRRREKRPGGAQRGFLQQRFVGNQVPELLGKTLPRNRP
jgi:hypothetical protein